MSTKHHIETSTVRLQYFLHFIEKKSTLWSFDVDMCSVTIHDTEDIFFYRLNQ